MARSTGFLRDPEIAQEQMLEIMLVAAGLSLILLWWYVAWHRKGGRGPSAFSLPSGTTITAVPLLTESEVSLYNLMRIAAQEHYLVFAQVPLWSFVSVEATGKTRFQVLNHLALKRVDFVLVHPGSRQVEQVVQVETAYPRPHQAERQRVIESVLDAAGIKLVTLRSNESYTIPDLAGILGLETME
jgi:hypothetical protein